MIAVAAVVLTLAAPPLDPCVAVAAAPPGGGEAADAATAAIYRAVGDDERAAGDVAAATAAYREALRRAPGDARARASLRSLCAGSRFEEGLRLMQDGDRSGAVAAFEAARASGGDVAAALLEGICEYELGNDARARVLLAEARAEQAVAAPAQLFLGLIALRDGDGRGASSLFASAGAGDPRLSASASDLLRLSRRDGRVVLSALTEAGFDSNVDLTPDGTPRGAASADGYGALVAGAFARSGGAAALYARATAQYRQHLRATAYDLADVSGALGARAAGGRTAGSVEYAYDYVTLGRRSYLSAHRLLASGRLALGDLALAATYFARLESFLAAGLDGFSGLRHDVETQAEAQPGRRSTVLAGWHLGRDAAHEADFGYLEHGPFAAWRFRPTGTIRLAVEGRFTWRRYDVVDEDLGVLRADRYLDAAAAADVDLSARWTLRVSGSARRALSNVADFAYTRWTGGLALVYAAGIL